jgi:hypothetical protein
MLKGFRDFLLEVGGFVSLLSLWSFTPARREFLSTARR